LYFFIKTKKPKNILEIGTSNGFSTFWLSLAADKHKAVVHTIEVEKSRYELAKANLKSRKNVVQYLGMAEEIIPTLNIQFEFVFIDAGKINYLDYLLLILPKLTDSAIIIADNVISHQDSVKEYLDYVRYQSCFESMELNIGDGLEISIFHKKKEPL
jgi:predicted O-methyltransferase YrrM